MPILKWNSNDVVECLGVLPESDEFFGSQTFRKSFDSIRMEMTVWESESLVALSLFEGSGNPFLDLSFIVRDRIELVTESPVSSLRFHNSVVVSSEFWLYDDEGKPEVVNTTNLSTKPSFKFNNLS